eukprot:TRINITY_DN7915_c5_g1_i1.p1 TRINITY_DN7915_c5_g1~~TRINITY_DN7915_c5_g1_i1.p1  ORF type:complete len:399 (+),score=80.81 TRINITY_DN7915_c5_g1_i1:54-1199(+)
MPGKENPVGSVRKADLLTRVTDRGLRWAYFMKLYNFCADRWQRFALNVFSNAVKQFKRSTSRALMTRYFYRLQYYTRGNATKTVRVLPAATIASPARQGEFKIRIACDLFGVKKNIKVALEHRPTMIELINVIESQYDALARSGRPGGFPDMPFKIQTVQIFEHETERWSDLTETVQLTHGCQLYVFPPESYWHSDSQGVIPEAEEVYTWKTVESSPHRNRAPNSAELNAPSAEKARFVFYEMCPPGKDCLQITDLAEGFSKCDMLFDTTSAVSLFKTADMNHDGVITVSEWLTFAASSPNVVDALYFRIKDLYSTRKVHLPVVAPVGGFGASPSAAINLQLAQEYQQACLEATDAREKQRQADLRESTAKERLRQSQYLY